MTDSLSRPSPVTERAISLIDRRLEDLAEANAIYGKDQRLNAPDKIARNDRELSWLKDLRSEVVLIGLAQKGQERTYTLAEVREAVERVIKRMVASGEIPAPSHSSTRENSK